MPSLDIFRRIPGVLLLLIIAGCASGTSEIDRLETPNRAMHALNKGLDRAILRPVASVYGAVTPDPVQNGIRNGAENLGLPGDVINHALQGDAAAAMRMTTRFLLNSTIGLAGLFDPATDIGIEADTTDMGETLYTWGVGEGPYVELPVFGPSTTRAALGRVGDMVLNPLQYVAEGTQSDIILGAAALEIVDTRHRLAGVIDSTLYESADSYLAAQTAYLANRRRTLEGQTNDEDLDDPFAFDE